MLRWGLTSTDSLLQVGHLSLLICFIKPRPWVFVYRKTGRLKACSHYTKIKPNSNSHSIVVSVFTATVTTCTNHKRQRQNSVGLMYNYCSTPLQSISRGGLNHLKLVWNQSTWNKTNAGLMCNWVCKCEQAFSRLTAEAHLVSFPVHLWGGRQPGLAHALHNLGNITCLCKGRVSRSYNSCTCVT